MADKTVGELPAASELYDDSLLVVEQQRQARSITGELVRKFAREATADYAEQARKDADRAAEKAKDAEDVALHPPKIQGGSWWTWDAAKGAYADSGVDAGVSLTVGTVTTGEPGTAAKVTNRGTTADPILDFTIPKGAKGDPGGVTSVNGQTGAVTVTPGGIGAYTKAETDAMVSAASVNPAEETQMNRFTNDGDFDSWVSSTYAAMKDGEISSYRADFNYNSGALGGGTHILTFYRMAARYGLCVEFNYGVGLRTSTLYNGVWGDWKLVTPTALKNPNALQFTGAVNVSYDGSAPRSVTIPSALPPTVLEIDGSVRLLGASEQWDTLGSGLYGFTSANASANKPFNSGALLSIRRDGVTCVQAAFNIGGATPGISVRNQHSGTWSGWYRASLTEASADEPFPGPEIMGDEENER